MAKLMEEGEGAGKGGSFPSFFSRITLRFSFDSTKMFRGSGQQTSVGTDSMYNPVSGGYGVAAANSTAFSGQYLASNRSQWLTQYLRRIWSWEQMDFEQCFDQMVTLLGPEPSTINRVYKMAKIRKKTKNQWARDDPAFALVQVGFLLVSTAAWGVACLSTRFTLTKFIFFAVNDFLGYWLAGGILLSSLCASFANHKLIEHSAHSVAQVSCGVVKYSLDATHTSPYSRSLTFGSSIQHTFGLDCRVALRFRHTLQWIFCLFPLHPRSTVFAASALAYRFTYSNNMCRSYMGCSIFFILLYISSWLQSTPLFKTHGVFSLSNRRYTDPLRHGGSVCTPRLSY